MAEVNVGNLFDEFEFDLVRGIEAALAEGSRRNRSDENELVRFLLVAARRECSEDTCESLAKISWALAKPLRATVQEFGMPRDGFWVSAIHRNLPARLAGWVRVPESVAR